MKRIYALIVGFALALATPAVAHADFISGPTMTRQQAVDYVIARGLAQPYDGRRRIAWCASRARSRRGASTPNVRRCGRRRSGTSSRGMPWTSRVWASSCRSDS